MTSIVYAVDTCTVVDPNTSLKCRLVLNQVWAADDPLVKSLPHLFSSDPQVIRRTTQQMAPIETATAVPGVKRATSGKK